MREPVRDAGTVWYEVTIICNMHVCTYSSAEDGTMSPILQRTVPCHPLTEWVDRAARAKSPGLTANKTVSCEFAEVCLGLTAIKTVSCESVEVCLGLTAIKMVSYESAVVCRMASALLVSHGAGAVLALSVVTSQPFRV